MATCYYITKEAFDKLNDEIEDLEYKVLPVILKEVSTARGNGDLSENAEYHAAKDKQRAIMKKIGILKDFKVNAQVVDCSSISGDTIKFGAYVDILDIETNKKKHIRLVGDYEADFTAGFISISSPLGKSLLGKKVGDSVEVETPSGLMVYDILKLWY